MPEPNLAAPGFVIPSERSRRSTYPSPNLPPSMLPPRANTVAINRNTENEEIVLETGSIKSIPRFFPTIPMNMTKKNPVIAVVITIIAPLSAPARAAMRPETYPPAKNAAKTARKIIRFKDIVAKELIWTGTVAISALVATNAMIPAVAMMNKRNRQVIQPTNIAPTLI